MSNNTAVKVENLYKQYKLGVIGYGTLSADLQSWWAKVRGKEDPNEKVIEADSNDSRSVNVTGDRFWALKDISFEVAKGEVLGIIGRNGAGKSTLLKILSRITAPTKGNVKLKGRVASLLEVGTGFHPELTGRENIFLNGAILGMKRTEVAIKLDQIVAFAEVEKFLDTPVKRYSSGMYVRLAFAVAAHLEQDILIVDEVLAVGDAQFQLKCIGKMDEVAKGGRTVLFVSHNMGAIQQLCKRVALIHHGAILGDGKASKIVGQYLTMGLSQNGEQVWPDKKQAPGNEVVQLHAIRVVNGKGEVSADYDVRDQINVEIEYWLLQDVKWLDVSFNFFNERGVLMFMSIDNTHDTDVGDRKREKGFYRSICKIPPDLLNDTQVFVQAALSDERRVHARARDAIIFNVNDKGDPKGARGNYKAEWPAAAVRPAFNWSVEKYSLSHNPELMR